MNSKDPYDGKFIATGEPPRPVIDWAEDNVIAMCFLHWSPLSSTGDVFSARSFLAIIGLHTCQDLFPEGGWPGTKAGDLIHSARGMMQSRGDAEGSTHGSFTAKLHSSYWSNLNY